MDKKYQFGDVEVEVPEFNFRKVLPILLLSIFLFLVYNSAYSIQADEQGILLRLGKYNGTVYPGLHFKLPVIDEVYKVKTAKQFVEEFGFRTVEPGKRTRFSNTYEDESWTLTVSLLTGT